MDILILGFILIILGSGLGDTLGGTVSDIFVVVTHPTNTTVIHTNHSLSNILVLIYSLYRDHGC